MSALGHKQTFAVQKGISALASKADMCIATRDVSKVPKADIALVFYLATLSAALGQSHDDVGKLDYCRVPVPTPTSGMPQITVRLLVWLHVLISSATVTDPLTVLEPLFGRLPEPTYPSSQNVAVPTV